MEKMRRRGKNEEKENTLNSAPDDISSAGANRCLVKQMHKSYELLQTSPQLELTGAL